MKTTRELLVNHTNTERSSLIPILQELQKEHGYLSRDVIMEVSSLLHIPASKVFGVASFYNQFRFQPPGKHVIQICRGTACHVKGSSAILDTVKRELGIEPGQTTRDGLFSLEVVACVGACGLAPVICIDGEFFAGMTPEKVIEILNSYGKEDRNESRIA